MAKLSSAVEFTGRIQNLTYYKRQGSDKIIVRHASGVSKQRIKTDKAFKRTRQTNNEFKALNLVSRNIYQGLYHLHPVMDHNLYNLIMTRSRTIQKMHLQSPGKRGILVSQHGRLYEQLPFNRKFSLESILPVNLDLNMDTQNRSASIQIPALIPGVQFINKPSLPFFQFRAILQCIPDIIWNEDRYEPHSLTISRTDAFSNWHNSHQPFPGVELKLDLSNRSESGSLFLSFGIVFGKEPGEIVKYLGAGKILAVALP